MLRTYTGESIKVLSMFTSSGVKNVIYFYLLNGDEPSLFGHNWLTLVSLDWKSIEHVNTELNALLKKYIEIFKDELGTLKGVYAKLIVKPDAVPKIF